jgi:two-component system response regulator FixJ
MAGGPRGAHARVFDTTAEGRLFGWTAQMANEWPSVVLVEDDERLRDAVAGVLTMSGFRVSPYASAEAALAAAAWSNVACVVVDVRLPGMSGLDLLWRLRRRGDTTPALVVTADARSAADPMVRHLGVAAVLEKPVAGRALSAAIRSAIAGGVEAPGG